MNLSEVNRAHEMKILGQSLSWTAMHLVWGIMYSLHDLFRQRHLDYHVSYIQRLAGL